METPNQSPSPPAETHPGTCSVVIPVLNAEKHLPTLLPALLAQKPDPPDEIILVDSMSTDRTAGIAAQYERVRVIPIPNFSHGRSRNLGARAAHGEWIVLMTQDATPLNEHWMHSLLEPMQNDPRIAAAYSRQQPYPDANPMERHFLATHFPGTPSIQRRESPGQPLAFQRDVFFSNVSGAVRRDRLLEHPFHEDLIMSEDQQFARDVLEAGHAIAYQPSSIVLHSHNYTLRTVVKRYFDSVYSLTRLFESQSMGRSASMGASYLLREALHMLRHHPLWLPYYACYTLAKITGTLAAHLEPVLPRRLVKRLSLHSYHWE